MTKTRPRLQRSIAVAACALLLALTGCSLLTGKDDDVEIRTVAEASDQVNQVAQEIIELIGNAKLEQPTTNDAPCEGRLGEFSKDVFHVRGAYQVPLPNEQHIPTLARLRDYWHQQGYTVRDDRTFPDNTAKLSVKTPEGVGISLISTVPPTALALLVSTPCYKSPEPLY